MAIQTSYEGVLSPVRPNDMALSADGTKVYTVDNGGVLRIYDVASGSLVTAMQIGNVPLGGLDLSPDGQFLVAVGLEPVQSTSAGREAVTYKVDLSTGNVTEYPVTLTDEQYAFHDAAVMNDGTVVISGTIIPGWSGWAAMRTLNLATGDYTEIPGDYGEEAVISDSADGEYALFLPTNISDGPAYMYKAGEGVVADHSLYEEDWAGFNFGAQAFNSAAGLVAQFVGNLYIYDVNLQLRTNVTEANPELTGSFTGMTFSADGAYLFLLDSAADEIVQLSTADWSIVHRVPVGEDIAGLDGDFGNRLLVSADLQTFIVTTDYRLLQIHNPVAGLVLHGDSGDNALEGSAYNDQLYGEGGNDNLRGNGGDDFLNGGSGNDRLDGGAGADVMHGGAGNDTYVRDNIGDVMAKEDAQGRDLVLASVATTLGSNIENLTLTGIGTINGTGNGLANELTGNNSGNVLMGKHGDDRLVANGGSDLLDGGTGADIMYGGLGNDTYVRDNANDVAVELGGQGIDQVNASVSTRIGANIERLVLTGAAAIDGHGNAENNFIFGNSAANSLDGQEGDDQLIGNGGNDVLQGREGNDTLQGGEGNDALFGGTGENHMYGGGGADTFHFTLNASGFMDALPDTIHDFSRAQGDRINVSALDANATVNGDQAFHFVGSGAFDGAPGALRYEQSGGNTIIYGDTDGDKVADFLIRLDGLHTLSSGDFVL